MIKILYDYHKADPKKVINSCPQSLEVAGTNARPRGKSRALEILAELLVSPLNSYQIRVKYQLSADWSSKLSRIQKHPEIARQILDSKISVRAGIRAVSTIRNHVDTLWGVSSHEDQRVFILKTIEALFYDGDIGSKRFEQISKRLLID